MLTIIGQHHATYVVTAERGDLLYVTNQLAKTIKGFAKVRHENGAYVLSMKKDTLMVVERLAPNGKTTRSLRFARNLSHQEIIPIVITNWPELREALIYQGIKPIYVPGGLERAIIYKGEVLIARYKVSGCTGWIIKEEETGKYLNTLPHIEGRAAVTGKLWINQVGWLHLPQECNIQLMDYDPSGDKVLTFTDAQGKPRSFNHRIRRVEFDPNTYIVRSIIDQYSGNYISTVAYKTHPAGKFLSIGKHLPYEIRVLFS